MKYYGKATIYGYHSYELVLVNGELSSVHDNMNLSIWMFLRLLLQWRIIVYKVSETTKCLRFKKKTCNSIIE